MALRKATKSQTAGYLELIAGKPAEPPRAKSPRGDSKKRAKKPSKHAAARAKLPGLKAKVEARVKGWHKPEAVNRRTEAVETIFPSLDRVIGIGGWPVSRLAVIHGPAHHGKTKLLLGLLRSFLVRGHWAALLDAERTTDAAMLRATLGEASKSPDFMSKRPGSYEEAVDLTRSFCRTLEEARRKGDVDPETRGIIGLDSLTKLVPAKLLDALLENGAEKVGVDGFSGGAGRQMAALNSQWFRELRILMDESNVSFVIIGRERQNPDKRGRFDRTWKLGGGTDVELEADILARVTRELVQVGKKTVAQRHEVKVRKKKVGHLDEPVVAFFHTTEEGFDLPRDLAELALQLGVLKKDAGAAGYHTEDGEVVASNQEELVAAIRDSAELSGMLADACRTKE